MAASIRYTRDDLVNLKPRHDSFVGIDSDGCVFPTMEIKQKKCFHTLIISHWKLQAIEKYVREAAEFVNLYSKWRGANRFIALIKSFDLLRKRKEVIQSGIKIPELNSLRKFVESGVPLGDPSLAKAVSESNDPELASVLEWSRAVNADIARTVKNVPPFRWVRESLERITAESDAICVSQTPTEALVREWAEHGLVKYVSVIAGQELGTKSEHIALATKDKYRPERVLMIGDAPGDRKAAESNNCLLYTSDAADE